MISEVGVTSTGKCFHKWNPPLPGSFFHDYNRTLCHFGWPCTVKPLAECLALKMTPCSKCFTVRERIELLPRSE